MSDREGWAHSHVQRVRFGDLDAMQHMNNVEYLRFFESARIAYITHMFPGHDPTRPSGWGVIFAECHIRYRSPAHYDEEIRTWLRPEQLARSSFRMAFEMTGEADGRPIADGWGALVGYDYGASSAMPLPDEVRERLAQDVH